MDTVLGIDISHHNGQVDLDKAKAAGIEFVIAKATQGIGNTDPMFTENEQKAADAGLLFAAYHFATGEDPRAQAEHFLSVAEGVPVLVLDFEKNTSGGHSMSLVQAKQFVIYVTNKTGRSPILYTGSFLKDMHCELPEELAACPLWLSQYGPRAVLPIGFDKWQFWQYTDGNVGPTSIANIGPVPHEIDGIGHCDIDLFNGNSERLAAFWAGR